MRSFADQISFGLRHKGHFVEEITARPLLSRLAPSRSLAKWFGYFDMFILYPPLLWCRLRRLKQPTLCVVVDQALGPWIPLVASCPHFVHVHDLLALEAALGRQPFHRLGWSGRLYQLWIRRGFRHASFFLSDSNATRMSLEQQLQRQPVFSQTRLLPLMGRFQPMNKVKAFEALSKVCTYLPSEPFIFHIGRNWYKNRLGLLRIWEQLHIESQAIHLILVGSLEDDLCTWLHQRPHLQRFIHVLDHATNDMVLALYSSASALVFPSHAEGFGWPILEALACGCPVVTTSAAPMNEVGGDAVTYIAPEPADPSQSSCWALVAAKQVLEVINRESSLQEQVRNSGLAWVKQFNIDAWLDDLEAFYSSALQAQLYS
jgi:glycosyltransferase involved in cell wall biosynthesis